MKGLGGGESELEREEGREEGKRPCTESLEGLQSLLVARFRV